MAQVERRKHKRKRELEARDDLKPSKTEYAVAKYLREKLPSKKTTLLSHKVEYFNAAKAIDCLLESPWASGKDKYEQLFTTRESIVDYMNMMLEHKFFHRAKKIIVQKKTKKKKERDEEVKVSEEPKEKKVRELKGKPEKEKNDDERKSKEGKGNEGDEKKEGEEGEIKKKIKLDMHLEQYFVDGNEPYVWIYDPIPLKAWVIGTLLVIGAVAVCLFPLWPKTVRHYVYYLSIATALLLGVILSLAVIRHILFVIIWVVTLGRHHFWLLPNLTEDVGFFESFWPLYKHEYKGSEEKKDDGKKEKEASDGGEGDQNQEELRRDNSGRDSDNQAPTDSDRDSNGVQKSLGENGDNGFEILEPPAEKEKQS